MKNIFRKLKVLLIKLFVKEIWKDITNPVDFTGIYQISNFGRVKSLSRIKWSGSTFYLFKEKIRRNTLDDKGYETIVLSKNGINKRYKIHQLVFDHFNDKKREENLVIDHRDNNPSNNIINNLQLLTHRQNISKGFLIKNLSSKYTGVCWDVHYQKWISKIRIGKKRYNLGHFENEYDAHLAYQEKLESITKQILTK